MFETLRQLSGNRRFVLLGAVAALLVAGVIGSRWAMAPQYIPLYRGMDFRDAGSAAEALEQAGILYRLSDGGSSIEVPARDAARARVALAMQGLPANGRPGLELFDRPTWGMTDFTQRVTYRRALEGELARTIGGLRGIERAQVHLALPEASPLRRLERAAEAAVVVTLRRDAALSPSMVQGIAHLVSSSVENLASDKVAVIDDSGRLLSTPDEAGTGIGLTSRQLSLQQDVEGHLGRKVEQLLGTVVGPSHVRAQVDARLNFAQVDRTVEQYDPDGQVLANEQRSEGGTAEESGVANIVNNTYLNSRRIEKLVGEVGNVTRLTVSVMIDTRGLLSDGGDPETQRLRLEELARNAIGIDPSRGDQLTLVAVPFGAPSLLPTPTAADSVTAPRDPMDLVERLGPPVVLLIAVLAAFLLGLRALKPAARPGTVPALPGVPMADAAPAFAPTPEQVHVRNRIAADLATAPDSAAKVVRAWLLDAS